MLFITSISQVVLASCHFFGMIPIGGSPDVIMLYVFLNLLKLIGSITCLDLILVKELYACIGP